MEWEECMVNILFQWGLVEIHILIGIGWIWIQAEIYVDFLNSVSINNNGQ